MRELFKQFDPLETLSFQGWEEFKLPNQGLATCLIMEITAEEREEFKGGFERRGALVPATPVTREIDRELMT